MCFIDIAYDEIPERYYKESEVSLCVCVCAHCYQKLAPLIQIIDALGENTIVCKSYDVTLVFFIARVLGFVYIYIFTVVQTF